MDELRIYNRVLSDSEIKALATGQYETKKERKDEENTQPLVEIRTDKDTIAPWQTVNVTLNVKLKDNKATSKYALRVEIWNPNSYDLKDYQVKLELGNLVSKGIKIVDEKGQEIKFCYEQENGECGVTPSNVVWVRVPHIPANGETVLYIKESDVSHAVEGSEVFDYYEPFTSLSGWSEKKWGGNSGDVKIDDGKLRIRVYKCYNIELTKDIGNYNGKYKFEFKWRTKADGWYEIPESEVYVNDERALFIGANGKGGIKISCGGDHSGISEGLLTANGNVKVKFHIRQSWACSYCDHFNTYLWIDWVRLRKYADQEPVVSIKTSNESQTVTIRLDLSDNVRYIDSTIKPDKVDGKTLIWYWSKTNKNDVDTGEDKWTVTIELMPTVVGNKIINLTKGTSKVIYNGREIPIPVASVKISIKYKINVEPEVIKTFEGNEAQIKVKVEPEDDTLALKVLPYWIEEDNGYKVWVKVPKIPAGGEVKLKIKKVDGYKPNGDKVFIFFDDFDSKNVDKWNWPSNWKWTKGEAKQTHYDWGEGNKPIISKDLNIKITDKIGVRAVSRIKVDDCWAYDVVFRIIRENNDETGLFYTESNAWYGFFDHGCFGWCCCLSGNTRDWHVYELEIFSNSQTWYKDGQKMDDAHKAIELIKNIVIQTKGRGHVDYVFVAKCARTPPTVMVEQADDGYVVTIKNPNNYDLTDFQVAIDGSKLGISSKDESLLITTGVKVEVPISIDIENLPEDAKVTQISSTEWVITWTPSYTFVPSTETSRNITLTIKANILRQELTKTATIEVFNVNTAPKLIAEPSIVEIYEGNLTLITLKLKPPILFTEQLPYWIEEDNGYKVWVKVPKIPAGGEVKLKIKKVDGYKPDGDKVFDFFDDFVHDKFDFKYGPNEYEFTTFDGRTVIRFDSGHDKSFGYNLGFDLRGHVVTVKAYMLHPSLKVILSGDCCGKIFTFNRDEWGRDDWYGGISTSDDIRGGAPTNKWVTVTFRIYKDNNVRVERSYAGTFTKNLCSGNSGGDCPINRLYIGTQNWGKGRGYYDYLYVRKLAEQEPIVTIEQADDGYVVTIKNPNNYDLTDFQVAIDGSKLGISSKDESLLIMMAGASKLNKNIIVSAINAPPHSIIRKINDTVYEFLWITDYDTVKSDSKTFNVEFVVINEIGDRNYANANIIVYDTEPTYTVHMNQPPIITLNATTSITDNDPIHVYYINPTEIVTVTNIMLKVYVNAIDPDGTVQRITAEGLPSGAKFDNNVFTWTPKTATTVTVTFIAVDDKGLTTKYPLKIIVIAQSAPKPPAPPVQPPVQPPVNPPVMPTPPVPKPPKSTPKSQLNISDVAIRVNNKNITGLRQGGPFVGDTIDISVKLEVNNTWDDDILGIFINGIEFYRKPVGGIKTPTKIPINFRFIPRTAGVYDIVAKVYNTTAIHDEKYIKSIKIEIKKSSIPTPTP
jgi:hypothetical protein